MKKKVYYLLKRFFLKPNSENIYWEKIIASFIIVLGLMFFAYYNQVKVNKKTTLRNNFPQFTIGFIIGYNNNLRGSKTIDYKYYVSGRLYKGWDYITSSDIRHERSRYLVKYYSKDPSNAEILLSCLIPDTVESVPYNGWKQLPFECNEINR